MPPHATSPIALSQTTGPVFRARCLEERGCELWVKDDGSLSPLYGGNKVRKLEWLLAEAKARGCRRLLTAGAAGSHHVLATALFGRMVGLPTAAVLCPQPDTSHARETLARSLSVLQAAYPCSSMALVPWMLARHRQRGDALIPVGGSNTLGAMGYDLAVDELVGQIRGGELPQPHLIVVAVGSGGTAAGLLAGLVRHRLTTNLCAVQVLGGRVLTHAAIAWLVAGLAASRRIRWKPLAAVRRLSISGSQVGRGYGHPTAASELAMDAARSAGLALDPTYTAKAFAEVLAVMERAAKGLAYCSDRPWTPPVHGPLRILYWHTLSSVEPEVLPLEGSSLVGIADRLLLGCPLPQAKTH